MKKASLIVSTVRRYREKAGLTQKQISDRTGISLSTIKRIETGIRSIAIDEYENYLNVLDISHIDALIAMNTGSYTFEREIAALSRKLPIELQHIHLKYLLAIIKTLN